MLCDEIMFVVMEKYGDVYSNIQFDLEFCLKDINCSIKYIFFDFGDDDFINGKLYLMIDFINCISCLIEEVCDLEVVVIVMDFVFGFGLYEDLVGFIIEMIKEVKVIVAVEGCELIIFVYVLGIDFDMLLLE